MDLTFTIGVIGFFTTLNNDFFIPDLTPFVLGGLGDLASGLASGISDFFEWLFTVILEALNEYIIRPLFEAIFGLIVNTPTPYQEEIEDGGGLVEGMSAGQPESALWAPFYDYTIEVIIPASMFILSLQLILVFVLASMSAFISDFEKAKSFRRIAFAFFAIPAWWLVFSMSTAFVDALANFIAFGIDGSESSGFVGVFDELTDAAGDIAQIIIMLILLLTVQLSIIIGVILLYTMRYILLFTFSFSMPILIALWPVNIGFMAPVSQLMSKLMKMYVPLLFMTLPNAFIIRTGELLMDGLSPTGLAEDAISLDVSGFLAGIILPLIGIVIPLFALIAPKYVFSIASQGFGNAMRTARMSSMSRSMSYGGGGQQSGGQQSGGQQSGGQQSGGQPQQTTTQQGGRRTTTPQIPQSTAASQSTTTGGGSSGAGSSTASGSTSSGSDSGGQSSQQSGGNNKQYPQPNSPDDSTLNVGRANMSKNRARRRIMRGKDALSKTKNRSVQAGKKTKNKVDSAAQKTKSGAGRVKDAGGVVKQKAADTKQTVKQKQRQRRRRKLDEKSKKQAAERGKERKRRNKEQSSSQSTEEFVGFDDEITDNTAAYGEHAETEFEFEYDDVTTDKDELDEITDNIEQDRDNVGFRQGIETEDMAVGEPIDEVDFESGPLEEFGGDATPTSERLGTGESGEFGSDTGTSYNDESDIQEGAEIDWGEMEQPEQLSETEYGESDLESGALDAVGGDATPTAEVETDDMAVGESYSEDNLESGALDAVGGDATPTEQIETDDMAVGQSYSEDNLESGPLDELGGDATPTKDLDTEDQEVSDSYGEVDLESGAVDEYAGDETPSKEMDTEDQEVSESYGESDLESGPLEEFGGEGEISQVFDNVDMGSSESDTMDAEEVAKDLGIDIDDSGDRNSSSSSDKNSSGSSGNNE